MYRDNEASRVGEVLSCKLSSDTPGMIAAAVRLWLLPVDPRGEGDGATEEVWTAIEAANATSEAVHAGVMLIRERQQFRASAFIEIVENLADPALLLELAGEVLAARWPSHPYLVALFLRLVDLKQEDGLWAFMRQHRARMGEDTPTWTLGGFILTTTRIGDRYDVDTWFRDFENRPDVPMWLIAAYAASILQLPGDHSKKVGTIALAAARMVPDTTATFLLIFKLIDELLSGKDEAFLATIREHVDSITSAAGSSAPALHLARDTLDHPIVRYVNSATRRTPIALQEFEFSIAELGASPHQISLIALAAKGPQPRPVHWRLVGLIQELHARTAKFAHMLSLFHAMLDTPHGDARVTSLYRDMQKSRPKELPQLQVVWRRLVKQRLSWLTRLKLEYF